MLIKLLIVLLFWAHGAHCRSWPPPRGHFDQLKEPGNTQKRMLYTISGKIVPMFPFDPPSPSWLADITLSLDEGKYLGFVREDGSFVMSGIPPGSYVLYVYHADISFQPVRVEIAQNGRIRARKLGNLRTTLVMRLPYPLRLTPGHRFRYFRIREQWNILDYMLNPMVLLMVVPLVLMLLLPRLINDPETKRELEAIQFPKMPSGMPDLSDALTSFLSGKRPPEKEKKPSRGIPYRRR